MGLTERGSFRKVIMEELFPKDWSDLYNQCHEDYESNNHRKTLLSVVYLLTKHMTYYQCRESTILSLDNP